MVKLWHILAMVVLVTVLHFGAVWSGFYDWQFSTRVFWFDNVLHVLVGIGFAMAALFITERYRLSGLQTLFFVLGFVLVGAVAWELVEYIFFTRFTEYAYWSRIYSPSLYEASSDVISDLLGGAAYLLLVWHKLPKH
ncbi:hypothetical protein IT396_01940 [Candidatus Nomurabacteria bacterium]|nr:hypothetical protein [Candidatus Nomurabacteria bacterium]